MHELFSQLEEVQSLLEQSDGSGEGGAEGGAEKILLTPDVRTYAENGLRAVQEKLRNGEQIYDSDLEFVDWVKDWMALPAYWRAKGMDAFDALFETLVEMGEMGGERNPEKWVEEYFDVKGGKIVYKGFLNLGQLRQLKSLPEGLVVEEALNLMSCKKIEKLPNGLSVGGDLILIGCSNLKELPEGLYIKRELAMPGRNQMTKLPAGLKVDGDVELENSSLLGLPEDIYIGGEIRLKGCASSLIEDAKRLKAAGKIKGNIIT